MTVINTEDNINKYKDEIKVAKEENAKKTEKEKKGEKVIN